jgi:hypothetical protein
MEADPWTKGTMDRNGWWAFFGIGNLTGFLLGVTVIYAVWRSRKRKTSNDIFVCCYISGCAQMSIPCAMQCLINWGHGTGSFYGAGMISNEAACFIEAFAHVSAIMVQFFGVALIAIRNYLLICHKKVIGNGAAVIIFIMAWIVGLSGTLVIGFYSKIYLMPAGTFCFYQFASPAIAFWFVPVMLMALGIIIFCYYKIWRLCKDISKVAGSEQQRAAAKVAFNTITYTAIFLIGWLPAVITCFYELIEGNISQEFDSTVGLFGTMHSVVVPIAYGWNLDKVERFVVLVCKKISPCYDCFPNYVIREAEGEHHTVIDNVSAHDFRSSRGSGNKNTPSNQGRQLGTPRSGRRGSMIVEQQQQPKSPRQIEAPPSTRSVSSATNGSPVDSRRLTNLRVSPKSENRTLGTPSPPGSRRYEPPPRTPRTPGGNFLGVPGLDVRTETPPTPPDESTLVEVIVLAPGTVNADM